MMLFQQCATDRGRTDRRLEGSEHTSANGRRFAKVPKMPMTRQPTARGTAQEPVWDRGQRRQGKGGCQPFSPKCFPGWETDSHNRSDLAPRHQMEWNHEQPPVAGDGQMGNGPRLQPKTSTPDNREFRRCTLPWSTSTSAHPQLPLPSPSHTRPSTANGKQASSYL